MSDDAELPEKSDRLKALGTGRSDFGDIVGADDHPVGLALAAAVVYRGAHLPAGAELRSPGRFGLP